MPSPFSMFGLAVEPAANAEKEKRLMSNSEYEVEMLNLLMSCQMSPPVHNTTGKLLPVSHHQSHIQLA